MMERKEKLLLGSNRREGTKRRGEERRLGALVRGREWCQ
jgi:hypothetical protein